MKTLIVCGLGALALTACQRPAEPAADDAIDAVAMTDDPSGGSMAAGGAAASGSASGGASSSAGRTSGERLSPSGAIQASGALATAPGVTGSTGPTDASQATRDAAKAEAEATNLHPRTP